MQSPGREQKALRLCHSCHPWPTLACKERLWADRPLYPPASLPGARVGSHRLSSFGQQQRRLYSCRAAGPHILGPRAKGKMRCKKAVQQSQTSRASSPAGSGTAGSVTPGCCCCLWGVHGDTHVHRAVLDSQDTNRFFQCRHGKHRASGTGIWQLSGISSERSGIPWELKS